jgi:hypothetical protein
MRRTATTSRPGAGCSYRTASYDALSWLPVHSRDVAVELCGELHTFIDVDRTFDRVSGSDQRRRSLQARGNTSSPDRAAPVAAMRTPRTPMSPRCNSAQNVHAAAERDDERSVPRREHGERRCRPRTTRRSRSKPDIRATRLIANTPIGMPRDATGCSRILPSRSCWTASICCAFPRSLLWRCRFRRC